MTDLSRDLRRALETTVKAARDAAELAAADALRRLGVFEQRRPEHLTELRNAIRKRLRAHAKSLGDRLDAADGTALKRLTEAAAYVQWHRLLFARFLVERGLLRDEAGIVVSLADCREEAAMGGIGDEWSIASAHAARLLPGVFPPDDAVEALVLAPEHAKALRDHLRRLDPAVFAADDSLGWTYQFWRAAEKKAVNDSQVKIGAAELPAVTQLFTEPYMVRFLLHNTLGAWWAGKVLSRRPDLAKGAANEAVLRVECALPGYAWEYLRFVREGEVWRPAAGSFSAWPEFAASIKLLDPCCGSGHFLTEALAALTALRAAEDGLPISKAVIVVLRENLHGLEIDGRCVQIAAFALALTAWRIGGAELVLPVPHVAWVGAPPPLPRAEFAALANGDSDLRRGLETLHDLFAQAPLLGSLIEVTGGDLVNPTRIARIEESIAALVDKMRGAEPERVEGALAARGMADAAAILARRWTLIVTNVPFLGYREMSGDLVSWISSNHGPTKGDLGYSLWRRLLRCTEPFGVVAVVTLQHWRSAVSYTEFRRELLSNKSLCLVAYIGAGAFRSITGQKVNITLSICTTSPPVQEQMTAVHDCSVAKDVDEKQIYMVSGPFALISQKEQLANPAYTITFHPREKHEALDKFAWCLAGIMNGDTPRFVAHFWEVAEPHPLWAYLQSTVDRRNFNGGRERIVFYDEQNGHLREDARIRRERLHNSDERGNQVWGKVGIAVNQMADLSVNYYFGNKYDSNVAVIVPRVASDTQAIAAFCTSATFSEEVRKIEQKLNITNATFGRLAFDVGHWRKVGAEKYPNGLPDPYSDDPTQWLFHGHPRYAKPGTELHVAIARLAGYRWPAETDADMRLSPEAHGRLAATAKLQEGNANGLLPLVPVMGERSLADRLRAYCASVWGETWTIGTEAMLISAACERTKDKPPKQLTLEFWLRTHAARQHAKLFHDRPFLWWITDGRVDGFATVSNYHQLTRATLERLTYTVLGDWITRLGTDPRAEATLVLQAKLARILEGEAPFDIFVRWKSLAKQPFGWEPDLNDGVRQNARPFIEAGVLSYDLAQILKDSDRGRNVASAPWFATFNGERRNDHHTTLEQKRAARAAAAA